MKKLLRSSLCIILALSMVLPASLGALAVDYPAGVTQQMCEESSVKTDALIKNAAGAFLEASLKDTIYNELYKNETLTSLLTGIYSSLAESATVLSVLGINTSVSDLAVCLSDYPAVSKRLSEASGWDSVNLEGVKWGIKSKEAFADAVGAILAPFNDVLYMLLCSGKYKAGIISIPGDDGYEKGLISMLTALGCTYILPADNFKYDAYYNRNKMMSNIVLSLLSLVDEVAAAPSQKLCEVIPNLADYIKNGGLEESVNALLRPLTIHIGDYIQLFTGSQMISFLMFIQNPSKYTLRFSENITLVMNEMLQSTEITLPEIDLDALISCKGDKGGAYRFIMTWLIDAVKLNSDKISEMLPEEEGTEQIIKIAENLLNKNTDELFIFIVNLFTAKEGKKLEYQWQSHAYTQVQAQYSEEMGVEEVSRVLDGIDETISQFIVEMTGGEPLTKTVKGLVYSNDLLTTLVKGLYGALAGEETKMIADVLSLPSKPYQLSLYMKEGQLYSARSILSRYSSWERIESINWGFKDGSRDGFRTALVAALRPLRPVLEAFLANGTIEILGSVNIGGSNGYNTAVIPLLEALGCPKRSIKTYKQYEKGRGSDKIITDVVEPVLSLIDKFAKRPVYNLTAILPNVLFFIDNGSLMQCLDNLIYPLTSLLGELSVDMKSLGFDIDEIKNTDILSKVMEAATGMIEGINLGNPDIKKLAGMGELTQIKSKRTYNDSRVNAEYVKANQNDVLITVLTYVIGLLTSEENSGLLSSFMGGGTSGGTTGGTSGGTSGGTTGGTSGGTSGGTTGGTQGGNAMFDQYSAGIGEQLGSMTPEEALQWLYKLFFRERAVVETTEEEYTGTIIYVPQEKVKHSKVPAVAAVMVLIAAGAYAFVRKDSIADWFRYRKEQKNDKKQKKVNKEG